MINVKYDHQIFSEQKYGGISRYFVELEKKFSKMTHIKTNIYLVASTNAYLSKVKKNFIKVEIKNKILWRINYILNSLYCKYKLRTSKYDVFHPTYYNPYFLNSLGDKPFVITVHDMVHEIFYEKDILSKHKKILFEKATKIIAISENTKKDLIKFFDIDEEKIVVIYHGNSMNVEMNLEKSYIFPKKYILFVGKRDGYKNFNMFIQSISSLLHDDPNLSVVCVGGGSLGVEELLVLERLRVKERVFQFNLDDASLAQCYRNAELFVFPSLYEGFGIPILESFACSCPLVCSNTSSLPEIAKDAAKYFDPNDEVSMHEAIKTVLDSKEERKKLIKNGIERLTYFSWEKAAKETREVYRSVLK